MVKPTAFPNESQGKVPTDKKKGDLKKDGVYVVPVWHSLHRTSSYAGDSTSL